MSDDPERHVEHRLEGGDGLLTALATIGGAIYAALAFVALALNAGIRTMSDDTYHHTVYPGLLHAADDASYMIHATGGAAVGAMIIAASVAAMRARAVPTWAGWLGIVAGILGIFSILSGPGVGTMRSITAKNRARFPVKSSCENSKAATKWSV